MFIVERIISYVAHLVTAKIKINRLPFGAVLVFFPKILRLRARGQEWVGIAVGEESNAAWHSGVQASQSTSCVCPGSHVGPVQPGWWFGKTVEVEVDGGESAMVAARNQGDSRVGME